MPELKITIHINENHKGLVSLVLMTLNTNIQLYFQFDLYQMFVQEAVAFRYFQIEHWSNIFKTRVGKKFLLLSIRRIIQSI